ncbi:MAG: hypothetical protein HYY44_02145 [Deltaproteobacteria bacterium]|nr:hypothetical protein [Deltaproteobacteria bacterium]
MSDLITGLGDRVRLSVGGVTGGSGSESDHKGISGRFGRDVVEGSLVIAPRFGVDWKQVDAKGSVERAETAQYAMVGGLALGLELRPGQAGSLGLQAIFETGFNGFNTYEIRRYSGENETIRPDSERGPDGLSLRTGAEFLLERYRLFGEGGLGVGFLMGIYGIRDKNLLNHREQWGSELQLGALVSFE